MLLLTICVINCKSDRLKEKRNKTTVSKVYKRPGNSYLVQVELIGFQSTVSIFYSDMTGNMEKCRCKQHAAPSI